MKQDALTRVLAKLPVSSPFPFPLRSRRCLPLDLGSDSTTLDSAEAANAVAFQAWIADKLRAAKAEYAVGGYDEDRALYRVSDLFGTAAEEPRSVHLGIDLWLASGTPVLAVLPGIVHSTRDNKEFGDYGPTIIMEHQVDGLRFHTLYGHLARPSLVLTKPGRQVHAGEQLGWLGEPHENVGWPPHLHFQIIRDLEGREGDFPGVCKASERAPWLARCPDPNLLLRIAALNPARSPRAKRARTTPAPVARRAKPAASRRRTPRSS